MRLVQRVSDHQNGIICIMQGDHRHIGLDAQTLPGGLILSSLVVAQRRSAVISLLLTPSGNQPHLDSAPGPLA
jgi:hypothetical protein